MIERSEEPTKTLQTAVKNKFRSHFDLKIKTPLPVREWQKRLRNCHTGETICNKYK